MLGEAQTKEQPIEYKETINYSNMLLRLLNNVAAALQYGGSGWEEFEILWRSIPRDIKDDTPGIDKQVNIINDKISKLPNWGSWLDKKTGHYTNYNTEKYRLEKDFVKDFAYEEVINCLHRHKLLFISDKALETGTL